MTKSNILRCQNCNNFQFSKSFIRKIVKNIISKTLLIRASFFLRFLSFFDREQYIRKMWKSFQFVFILCEVIVVSWAFNIENRDPYVKKGPDSVANTYFGFSVALHKTSESDSFAVNW
ncbi:hypothetical protein GWI33_020925 [Rhynchophorus ferrugineus]|uniref:Uncharacterized protein n=1 Tax=Rhynchophorus ferrugineus TaxID=354439 RepID=A0A834HVW4_RHYFE|nr:hypothetical protein GWI33_020925 [Rhynchophorus ferrugineus]